MSKPRVGFYGDGRLDGQGQGGHFEYGPERNGNPAYFGVKIPVDIWGKCENPHMTARDRETYRQLCHDHLLPRVPLAPGEMETVYGCEWQGQGVALVRHVGRYTTFGCWDRTADRRGNCYALFWIEGHLSASEMIKAIKRDFPQIWARITKPRGMAISAQSDPDPEETRPLPEPKQEVSEQSAGIEIPEDFFAQAMGERIVLDEQAAESGGNHEARKQAR